MSDYTDRVEANLKGLKAVSTGVCPGCEVCAEDHGFGENMEDFEHAWSSCGICGNHLSGTMHVWHWVDDEGEIMHETDACVDCVVYLANGEEPES